MNEARSLKVTGSGTGIQVPAASPDLETIVRRLAECRTDAGTEIQYLALVNDARAWVKAVAS